MYFRPSISWTEILKRTAQEIGADNCLGLAAQLAFYFFLALFPALLFLVALIGYLPVENALAGLLEALGAVAPGAALTLLKEQLDALSDARHGSLLTLGIVGAIWSSSAAMVAIIDALNHAYDVEEWRPWVKRRSLAILLTISLALFIIASLALVLLGPALAGWAADRFGLAPAVEAAWRLARWPVIFALVVFGVDLVYYFAPNRKARWAWITPGSLVATVLWIATSVGFRLYVTNFADYNATYGAIGGVIVILLWFYVSAFAILIGAELNGVIEQAEPPARPGSGSA
ncbi:MAG: YihY/virulence factor BrkB family protein [Vicinamibacterales bacterium]